jgi:hypothetical protein
MLLLLLLKCVLLFWQIIGNKGKRVKLVFISFEGYLWRQCSTQTCPVIREECEEGQNHQSCERWAVESSSSRVYHCVPMFLLIDFRLILQIQILCRVRLLSVWDVTDSLFRVCPTGIQFLHHTTDLQYVTSL